MRNHVSPLTKSLENELRLLRSQNAHVSGSWGRLPHITMECWNANATSVVAYCHIDVENPLWGEVLDPDSAAIARL